MNKFKTLLHPLFLMAAWLMLVLVIIKLPALLRAEFSIFSMIVTICGLVGGFFVGRSLVNWLSERKTSVVLTVVLITALIPRLSILAMYRQVQISDFGLYLRFAHNFVHGNFLDTTLLPYAGTTTTFLYHFPFMGGMSVINGLLMNIFSFTLFGASLSGVVYTSIIAALLYLIASRISKKVGIVAALLSALWPSNFFFAQVFTNQHLAILFLLLGLFFLIKFSEKQHSLALQYLFVFLAAVSFVLSNWMHESIIVFLIALSCTCVMFLLGKTRGKEVSLAKLGSTMIIPAITFVLCFIVLSFASTSLVYSSGLSNSQRGISPMFKILIGTNVHGDGGISLWTDELNQLLYTPREEQTRFGIEIVESRLRTHDPRQWAEFLLLKQYRLWNIYDGSFFAFRLGMITQPEDAAIVYPVGAPSIFSYPYSEAELRPFYVMRSIDVWYAWIAYVLACIGAFLTLLEWRRGRRFYLAVLSMWFVFGWSLLHLISEVQPRYRYTAMPFIFILAAYGLRWLYVKTSLSDKMSRCFDVLLSRDHGGRVG